VAAQHAAGLLLGSPTGLTSIESGVCRRTAPDARLARLARRRIVDAAQSSQRIARHVADGRDRIVKRGDDGVTPGGIADQPERAHRAGAHRRMRIPRRGDQRGDGTLLAQLAEDQRRSTRTLYEGSPKQRVLDVIDLRGLRARRGGGERDRRHLDDEQQYDQRPTREGRVQGVFRITRPGDKGQWKAEGPTSVT
jgi:hypothetical protein